MSFQWTRDRRDLSRRKREDLKARAIECNEVLVDQAIASSDVVIKGKREGRADSVIAIEADAETVSSENEKDIKSKFVAVQRSEKTIAEKAVRDEGETLPSDGANAIGDKRSSERV
jgi:hypothetical protein